MITHAQLQNITTERFYSVVAHIYFKYELSASEVAAFLDDFMASLLFSRDNFIDVETFMERCLARLREICIAKGKDAALIDTLLLRD